jgi:hypothetical protein
VIGGIHRIADDRFGREHCLTADPNGLRHRRDGEAHGEGGGEKNGTLNQTYGGFAFACEYDIEMLTHFS